MTKKKANFYINDAWILGIITSLGYIDSVCVSFNDPKNIHADHFNIASHSIRWRWSWDAGIHFFGRHEDLSQEDYENIRNHITKKYGIPFINAWHDTGYITKIAGE